MTMPGGWFLQFKKAYGKFPGIGDSLILTGILIFGCLRIRYTSQMEINNFHISLNCCVSVVLGAPSKGDIDRVTEIAHCVEKSATGEWNPQVLRYHEKSTKTHHFWLVVSIMVFMFHDIWDNPSH
jgi:hypothetical protein